MVYLVSLIGGGGRDAGAQRDRRPGPVTRFFMGEGAYRPYAAEGAAGGGIFFAGVFPDALDYFS